MNTTITSNRLQGFWKFFHQNGILALDDFCLLPSGDVAGYDNFNERHWKIEDGLLVLMNENFEPTTRFHVVDVKDGKLFLAGNHLVDPSTQLFLTQLTTAWPRNPGTRIALANRIKELGWEVGYHTYGVPTFVESGPGKFRIRKYCSIAHGVTVSLGDHRTDTVSTYPFAGLAEYWPSVPADVSDHTTKGDIVIGNDVWIGSGAFIGSGVTVGDGAVIGARSVITRNVRPYAVVVGTNRVIRYRFDDQIIERLLQICWWDWPDDKVDRFLPLMIQPDIDAFIAGALTDKPIIGPDLPPAK